MKILFFPMVLFCLAFSRPMTNEVYEINITTDKSEYSIALIIYDDAAAKMRIKYYRNSCSCTDEVEETMQLEAVASGYHLTGTNPVYYNSGKEYPNKLISDFKVMIDYYGDWEISNIQSDDDIVSSSIRIISDYPEKVSFLKKFDMDLN